MNKKISLGFFIDFLASKKIVLYRKFSFIFIGMILNFQFVKQWFKIFLNLCT